MALAASLHSGPTSGFTCRRVSDGQVQPVVRRSSYPNPADRTTTVPLNKLGRVMLDVPRIVEVELELILLVPVGPARLLWLEMRQVLGNYLQNEVDELDDISL